ncbi:MAG: hypothetical protein INH43_19255 [Acidobacteriaceae bacterium]|nr:hypothetical protein [Acidobacteriaceae bacterium]
MTLSQKFYAATSLDYLLSWLALDYVCQYLPSRPISGVNWECVKEKTRTQLNSRERDPSRSLSHLPNQQNYKQLIGDMAQWIHDCEIDCGFKNQQWLRMLAYSMTEHSLSQQRPENLRTADGVGLIQWTVEHPVDSKQFRSQPSYSGPMSPSWYDVLPPVAPENLTPWDLSYLLMVPHPEDNYWSESEKEFIVKDSIVMVIEAIWSASLAWVRRDPLLFASNCFEVETHWADLAERLSQINNEAKCSLD